MRHGGRGERPHRGTRLLMPNSCNCAVCLTTSATSGNQQGRQHTGSASRAQGSQRPEASVRPARSLLLTEGALLGPCAARPRAAARPGPRLLPRAPGGSLPRQPWTWPTMWTHGAPSVEGTQSAEQ